MKMARDWMQLVVAGCRQCQSRHCDGSVGYAGSPDDTGETTMAAMIMNL